LPKLFPIAIEVEESVVGKVYRMLDEMPGVAKIKIGDKAVAGGKPNGAHEPQERGVRGPYKKYDAHGDDVVMKILLASKMPLTSTHLKDHFVALGRAPTSINSLIHIMKKRGDIEVRDDGYVLSKKVKDRLRHRVAAKKTRR
jgi:hypothetical protein